MQQVTSQGTHRARAIKRAQIAVERIADGDGIAGPDAYRRIKRRFGALIDGSLVSWFAGQNKVIVQTIMSTSRDRTIIDELFASRHELRIIG